MPDHPAPAQTDTAAAAPDADAVTGGTGAAVPASGSDGAATSFSIGELSREFDVTPRTIRFYEDRGLLSPSRKGQTRVYAARDRVRLMLILRGKRLGFSITEIGEILDLYDAPDGEVSQLAYFVGKIRERRAALQTQAEDIQAVLGELDNVESRCLALLPQART